MVDALIRARRWVMPAGWVIDLRPAHAIPYAEISRDDGTVVTIGALRVDDERFARHRAADDAVRHVVNGALFTIEREQHFPFYRYATSMDELRTHVAADWRQTHLDPPLYSRGVELLRAHPGALRLREEAAIRILRPRVTAPSAWVRRDASDASGDGPRRPDTPWPAR